MPYVQFSDTTHSKIVSYFGGPQDETIHLNCEEIPTWDIRWKAYYDSLPDSFKVGLPKPTERWED